MAEYYDDIFALQDRAFRDLGGPGGINQDFSSAEDQNTEAFPEIAQLTQMINAINRTAQQQANAGRIPGGAGLEATSSGNIGRALRGEVDPSVLYQLGQQAAERGVSTGSPMGAGSNAAYLRALGLNTMDLMNTGQNWLTQATNRNPAAPIFDQSSMFITPGQFGSLEMERLNLPRGGGASGPSRIGGAPTITGSGPSVSPGINWSDLFGGDNRGLTPAQNNFAYGIGTGGSADNLIMGGSPSYNFDYNFFDPFSNALSDNPFA